MGDRGTQGNPSTKRLTLLMALLTFIFQVFLLCCCIALSGCSMSEAASGAVTGLGGMVKIMAGTDARKETVGKAKQEAITDDQQDASRRVRSYE
jgi:hypothetical protein